MREYKENAIIKIYKGFEDFENISSQIVAPFSENQIKVLRKKLKETPQDGDLRRLLEHLKFLRKNKEKPKHFGREEYYIDLDTGEILIKTKDGFKKVNGGLIGFGTK